MPRAASICIAAGCTAKTVRDGRCSEHQLRRPWQNRSARNIGRPGNHNTIRARVLARDRFTCQACGSREELEVDHIIPVARGGSWDDSNLITLCRECHAEKTRRDRIDP